MSGEDKSGKSSDTSKKDHASSDEISIEKAPITFEIEDLDNLGSNEIQLKDGWLIAGTGSSASSKGSSSSNTNTGTGSGGTGGSM